MQNNKNTNEIKYEKQLPDVFKELQEIRRNQSIERQRVKNNNVVKNTINSIKDFNIKDINIIPKNIPKIRRQKRLKSVEEYNFDIYQNCGTAEIIDHKFNGIGAIIGLLFFILFMTTIKSNYIFATIEEKEKRVIGSYEVNEEPLNLMNFVSENISETVKKEVITESLMVEREIEYIENDQIPKDEQIIVEPGRDEYREITYVRSYENNELIDEAIISDVITQESIKSIIKIGTSEFLANNKLHIGDTVYLKENVSLMKYPMENSESISVLHRYMDVSLQEEKNGWCRVIANGNEGYVKSNLIVSSAIEPNIIEKSRIKKVQATLDFNMDINKPSGLLKQDFEKIFTRNANDIYKIFENNMDIFYEIEQKYNINGIFVAAIGIHESSWGTSRISIDKKNLFGYGAYDSTPYASSYTFESYEYGIEYLAKMLSKYYINAPGTTTYDGDMAIGTYYNGPTIPGVNVRYASDKNWANRVYAVMTYLYNKLGN